ncbi:hypothetical protein M2454_000109 [Aequitasia blattaphilus]|nr:hypothetical protein [Aequitasia blattaphilus]
MADLAYAFTDCCGVSLLWLMVVTIEKAPMNMEFIKAHSMRTLSHCFICGHVHDELIIECSMGVSLDAVCEQMGRTPTWISGLLLRVDGFECSFYKKD